MLDRKQFIIFFAVFILLLLVLGFSMWEKGSRESGEDVSVEATYSSEVPLDASLTEPDFITAAAPESEKKFRTFHMGIQDRGFSLQEIVVEEGDTVLIKLLGGESAYDITLPELGIYQKVEPAEEKQIGFQTLLRGTFTYLCRDFCPNGIIKGSLIVK